MEEDRQEGSLEFEPRFPRTRQHRGHTTTRAGWPFGSSVPSAMSHVQESHFAP